jgi:hypothetical protein
MRWFVELGFTSRQMAPLMADARRLDACDLQAVMGGAGRNPFRRVGAHFRLRLFAAEEG